MLHRHATERREMSDLTVRRANGASAARASSYRSQEQEMFLGGERHRINHDAQPRRLSQRAERPESGSDVTSDGVLQDRLDESIISSIN
jgi:hypothetical protein